MIEEIKVKKNRKVREVNDVKKKIVEGKIEEVLRDIDVEEVKIGMV